MAQPPKAQEMIEDFVQEHAAMRDAVLDLIQRWSHLEGVLCDILAKAAGIRDTVVASHIFFSTHNSHTQLKMIDGVISHLRHHHSGLPLLSQFETLANDWKALRTRYNQLKVFRDAAAHRIIGTFPEPGKGQRVVLHVPIQNLSGLLKAMDNEAMLRLDVAAMEKAATEAGQLLADAMSFLVQLQQHLQGLGPGRPG